MRPVELKTRIEKCIVDNKLFHIGNRESKQDSTMESSSCFRIGNRTRKNIEGVVCYYWVCANKEHRSVQNKTRAYYIER